MFNYILRSLKKYLKIKHYSYQIDLLKTTYVSDHSLPKQQPVGNNIQMRNASCDLYLWMTILQNHYLGL